MRKISRTISGVTPVAVMARPMGCPGRCVYCPNDPSVPRSYTSESPAVLRGLRCDFDAPRQVAERLRTLHAMGHPTDKVELIIMGGTFLAAPVEYQYHFIKGCYDGLNGVESAGLEEAKATNETAPHRCVGLCIETRPDWCGPEEIARMLDFGATRVELGVQALDDSIYELVRRGHGVRDVVRATRLLKEHGFKVHYHWMPGLPGSNARHDLEMSAQLFADPDFRPDGLKLYPTLVVRDTELERWYLADRYHPYEMDELVELLAEVKGGLPGYVRVSRVMRDIPARFIVAGCRDAALRDALKRHLKGQGKACRCIRCREYGHRIKEGWEAGEPSLRRLDYESAGGREAFLSYEDDNGTLFGLLRMRLAGTWSATALVRELHVFGPEVPLQGRNALAAQHKGLGKALLQEAERIAREEFSRHKMLVLSGVGAREYYRTEFGYVSEGPYMAKRLNVNPKV
ncbi:MAG: tRNA uridine(34) 5-carboxymethylaminomethyl modification radical SAM/GNAT enzyme Elp3 [Chloroflexota bacterium]